MSWPSASVMTAFFQFGRLPTWRPRRLVLPRTIIVRTSTTSTLNSAFTALAISVLFASSGTSNTAVGETSAARDPFSVMRGRFKSSYGVYAMGQLLLFARGCGLQSFVQRGHRIDRQHQVVVVEDVVDVDRLDREKLRARQVANRLLQVDVVP